MNKATFRAFAAALTFAAATHLAAQNPPDARALVDGETEALSRFGSYQYTEDVTTKMTMQGVPVSFTMTNTVQAVNPGKIRMEMSMFGAPSSLMVSDGVNTWIYEPASKQYSKVGDASKAQEQLDAFTNDLAETFNGDGASSKVVRSESLTVDGAPHDCWVVESRNEKIGAGPMQFKDTVSVVWIDKELGIRLQQTMTGKVAGGPFGGPGDLEMKSVKRSLKFNVPLDEALFHFTPPPGARQRDDLQPGGFPPLTAQSPEPAPARPNAVVSNGTAQPQAFVPLLNPVHRVDPVSSAAPQSGALNGEVELLVTLTPEGKVASAEALSGPQSLRKPAMDAVAQWTYRPVIRAGRPVFAYTSAFVTFIDRSKPFAAGDLNLDPGEQMAAMERFQALEHQFPRSSEQVLADLEQDAGGAEGQARRYALAGLAKAALAAGALDKAALYSSEMLSGGSPTDWNYGNEIHDGNLVRGLIALRSGNIPGAAHDLLEAGKSPGSPQLNSFGPDMALAKGLLEAGEKDAVLEYLSLCRKFWKLGEERIDSWAETIRKGGTPDFAMSLRMK